MKKIIPFNRAKSHSGVDLKNKIKTIEKEHIERALGESKNNLDDASHLLGISKEALKEKIKKHSIKIA